MPASTGTQLSKCSNQRDVIVESRGTAFVDVIVVLPS
jgi:hypothetical protein